jgi:hypothetical protein
VTLGLSLLGLGLLAVLVRPRWARAASVAAAVVLGAAAALDAAGLLDTSAIGAALLQFEVLDLAGTNPGRRAVLLGAFVWCGPAADLVVRTVLRATSLPAPEVADEAGVKAGRWIGRLERWLLLVVVAAGQPALAIIPTGGKALLRYAEAVADARAGRQRLVVPGEGSEPGRDAFLDYVLVGSLASWTQAVLLGLLAAG